MKNPFRASLLKDLRRGVHGARLALPAAMKADADDRYDAGPIPDHDHEVWWWFLFRVGLRLDLTAQREQQLRRAAHDFAKGMFEQTSRHHDPAAPLRSTDPDWSPLIDLERIEVKGAPALRLIHRMIYQPGRETIMGHLLVPLRTGLVEARVLTVDTFTGTRESVLMAAHVKDMSQEERAQFDRALEDGSVRFLDQSQIDAREADAQFPQHCLSRARVALRWLEEASGLEIDEPWSQPDGPREIELTDLGSTFVPPPGFVHDSRGHFVRVSFCATDGHEHLLVGAQQPLATEWLREWAIAKARWILQAGKFTDVRLEARDDLGTGEPVRIVADCTGFRGPARSAFLFFRDTAGRAVYLWLSTSPVRSGEGLLEELQACARSWRASVAKPH